MNLKSLLVAFLTLAFINSNAQDQNLNEKKLSYELFSSDNLVMKFYEATNTNQLQEDTIFIVNSGFRIDPEWDAQKIGDNEYVIVTYPEFNGGKQFDQSKTNAATKLAKDASAVVYPLTEVDRKNARRLAIRREDFDKIKKEPIYSIGIWSNWQIMTGQLTIPFKFRPSEEDLSRNLTANSEMTTDITLGAYFGLRKRLSKRRPIYATVPLVLGLSFINLNDNTVSSTAGENSEVVPGWSWSTGVIFQVDRFNAGFVLGRDYASGVGADWLYNNETWYSFAIGYSFIK